MKSVWTKTTFGMALVMVGGAACAPDLEPELEVSADKALIAPWTPTDTACTTALVTALGTADGKSMSLLNKPSSCTFYGSTSTTTYGQSGCDGYIVQFLGTRDLPRSGETMRVVAGVNPKLMSIIGETACNDVRFMSRVYAHTANGSWSRYGAGHLLVGKWTGLRCDLIAAADNGEIPPFPQAPNRDAIRVVAMATGSDSSLSVMAGIKMGTCTPTPQPTGAICDADDECQSGYCAAGSCCGPSAAERRLCDFRELSRQ